MNAERFGSYSRRSTVAATLNLRRLKSTRRRRRLWPPPRCCAVMWPWFLRPPLSLLPRVSAFTGLPFHRPERSTITSCRSDGVIGLYVLRAITLSPVLQARGHVDLVTLDQRDDRLLPVAAHTRPALEELLLALHVDRVHRLDLDLEQAFDRLLDLGLAGVGSDLERHLAVLGTVRGLFRDQRGADDFVHARTAHGELDRRSRAHCRRSSRCFTASLVSTSVSRRRMS